MTLREKAIAPNLAKSIRLKKEVETYYNNDSQLGQYYSIIKKRSSYLYLVSHQFSGHIFVLTVLFCPPYG